MKLDRIRVVIRQLLNVGNFENIEPEVELIGNLEEGDNPKECASELHKMLQSIWAKQALVELSWVAMRRSEDADKMAEYTKATKGIRAQIKTLM